MEFDWGEEWRVIPEFSAYVMSVRLEVWSLPREVACKGGRTRQHAGKRIKCDDGRVWLCKNGQSRRFHVRDLFPQVFPELVDQERRAARQRPQVTCRKGHPLMEFDHEVLKTWMTPKPKLAYWGTGNRICLACGDAPRSYPTDNCYSLHFGVAGIRDYTGAPAEPKLVGRRPGDDRDQLAELDWADRGFMILKSPL
ncbi:hypothetical protein [Mycobacterium servetii]|uniref:Uncharacterized protein n=1 Tax=Mycobacterium servetii TaxID=3237418 RepID=A0ABV4BYH0_9MYCO